VLAAQLFMFLGEYMTASTFLRSGNDLSESIKLIAEVTVHDLVFAQGDIPGNLELAAAMAAKLSYALERNHNRQLATAWHLNECVDWLHAGQNYERVAEVLSVLPPQMDFVGLIRLVLLRRLETRDPSTWEALQLLAYRAKSFRKMWLALECIWEYAGQGEAIDCATSALSDPHWSLPFCRGFRRDLEDLIAGNPRFRH
jgi:hypothetical protein